MRESRNIPEVTALFGRRGRRWLILLMTMIVLAAWVGRFASLRMTLRPTPRVAYWRAQLAALDPPGAGAMPIEQVRKILNKCPRIATPIIAPLPTGPDGSARSRGAASGAGSVTAPPDPHGLRHLLEGPWDESRPDITAAGQLFSSAEFKSSRDAMRKAIQAGWWDEAIAVETGLTAKHSDYLEWSRCLVAHSRWAREHGHDVTAMTEDWLMTFGLARQSRRGRTLMSTLLTSAIVSGTGKEIGLAAREGTEKVDSAALARQVDALLPPVQLSDGLAKAAWIEARNSIDLYFVRAGGNWLDFSEFATGRETALYARAGSSVKGGPRTRLLNVASPLFHDYATACLNVDQLSAALASLTDLRACRKAAEAKRNALAEAVSVLDGQTGLFEPNDVNRIAMFYGGSMEAEAGLTRLALAEFNRQEGQYPDRLEELVPTYLPRLPRDCADWSILRYRRKGAGFVLYSIGPDGEDDGGRTVTSYSGGILENPGDVVFGEDERSKE